MTAATPLLIQSPTKQAVLSPTSAHSHVRPINTNMSSHTRHEAHEMPTKANQPPNTTHTTTFNITFHTAM